ncbi:tetratricopeptide repeat protein 4-like [Orbicella faveolata]|uniref:tetratricopeptide repeat protein 4-like n=1 Tax=Orbicella faveolata TaxID=48498 RepID=UPI0009E4E1E3|nr:tetratricopeptide repeat protein 4-like [Orbicella faveolata]XP_020609685.1 tetratricopeptide repeat protein 4-like [Orbicella faveolata]
MAESEIKSREAKVNFDEDVLAAIAEVYQEEGDKEFTRKEVCNAIYFYTEGIHVNCKDFQLNAKLYSSRARAYYHLGNFHEALNDATAAVNLEPTLIKAIETGKILDSTDL